MRNPSQPVFAKLEVENRPQAIVIAASGFGKRSLVLPYWDSGPLCVSTLCPGWLPGPGTPFPDSDTRPTYGSRIVAHKQMTSSTLPRNDQHSLGRTRPLTFREQFDAAGLRRALESSGVARSRFVTPHADYRTCSTRYCALRDPARGPRSNLCASLKSREMDPVLESVYTQRYSSA